MIGLREMVINATSGGSIRKTFFASWMEVSVILTTRSVEWSSLLAVVVRPMYVFRATHALALLAEVSECAHTAKVEHQ